jgi:hypothetical protein
MVYAEGESIRLAEIVAATYQNLRVGAIITDVTPRQVKAVGIAHDLEGNYAVRAEVVESTVDKHGNPFSERMRLVVAKAAQSKAMRDAIFRVVPKSLCKPVTNTAKQIALGEGLTMDQRRANAQEWITRLAVDPERVWNALGVGGVEELGTEELLLMAGLKTAIADNDISIDEAFPPLTNSDNSDEKGVNGLKARMAAAKAKKESDEDPLDDMPIQLPPAEQAEPIEGEQGPGAEAEVAQPRANAEAEAPAPGEADDYAWTCPTDEEHYYDIEPTEQGICPRCLKKLAQVDLAAKAAEAKKENGKKKKSA